MTTLPLHDKGRLITNLLVEVYVEFNRFTLSLLVINSVARGHVGLSFTWGFAHGLDWDGSNIFQVWPI